jgi:asparagine synthase (glutamine-hydrolysing)
VVTAHGEPLLGQDVIAHYRAFSLAREHGCAVALEGQGADELFAGLPGYETVMFLEWMRSGAWGKLVTEARIRSRALGRPFWTTLRHQVVGPAIRRWIRPVQRTYNWLAPEDSPEPVEETTASSEHSADPSMLNRFLFDLVRKTNLPAVLLIQDRNGMAHGVENRPPFLDHRLVEWAFRLPSSAKVGGGRRKRVLYDAAKSVVPAAVH